MYWLKIIRKVTFYTASIGAASFCVIAIIGLAKPGHAAANYSTDLNCTDASTEFNVVVVARVLDYQGNVKGYANNYSFHVNAFETNLAYKDYGPYSGWHANKQAGHDDYDRRANGDYRWRDFEANWHYYDSRNVDYSTGDHPKFSNEAEDWIKYRSEAIRRWNNGQYTRDGKNHDFNVTMDGNYVNGSLSGSGMATGKGNACQIGAVMAPTYAFRDGDNTHHPRLPTVNSYGSAAAWTNEYPVGTEALGHDGNNESWSLSCLGASDNGSININWMYFNFAITNQATWDRSYVTDATKWTTRQTAQPGGTWTGAQDKRAINGSSITVTFDYQEPAPPTPPTMTPKGSVTNISNPTADTAGYIEPKDFFTASGDVTASASTNGGSVNATWRVWYDTDTDFATATPVSNPPLLKNQTVDLSFAAAGGTQTIGNLLATQVPDIIANTYGWICSEVIINSASGSPTPSVPTSSNKRCLHIERRPYFQVLNGDINAAASLMGASGCPANTLSSISAFNRGAPTYSGASAGVAAFAAAAITELTSGRTPNGLTFANTPGAGDATYGGGFTNTFCIPDYWSGVTATSPTTIVPATGSTSVDADVYITGNSPNTSLAAIGTGTISLRWIVSTGNIYIDQNVTYLEGNYIAKGKIYTCATGIGSAVGLGSLVSCNQALTVNGSLIAGSGVKLQRTVGSTNSTPAETFIFSPDIWIQAIVPNNNVPTTNKGTLGKYDSITLLPPVL